jgi:hypothetical protein
MDGGGEETCAVLSAADLRDDDCTHTNEWLGSEAG